jgi:hypothetical protein
MFGGEMHFVESFCIKGEKKMDTQFRGELEFCKHFVREELAFMLWVLFVSPGFALCFALLPMVSSPFALP